MPYHDDDSDGSDADDDDDGDDEDQDETTTTMMIMMMSLRIERGDACTIGHRPPASGHAKKNYPRCLWVYSNPGPLRRIIGPQFLPEDREPRGIGYFQDRALRIPIFG